MDRRKFLKTSSAVVAGAVVSPRLIAQHSMEETGRALLPIKRGWRYSKTFSEAATAVAFDDSSFERIIIPHTNQPLPWHGFEDKSTSSYPSIAVNSRFPRRRQGSASSSTLKV